MSLTPLGKVILSAVLSIISVIVLLGFVSDRTYGVMEWLISIVAVYLMFRGFVETFSDLNGR